MKKKLLAVLTLIVISVVSSANIYSVSIIQSDSKTAHTIAVELVRKSAVFDSNGNVVSKANNDYYPIGASEVLISRQEIVSADVVLHAGVYVYNDPGTTGLELALYPSDPAITLSPGQKAIVDGRTVMDDGEPVFGNAYSVFGRTPLLQYELVFGAINPPAILQNGGVVSAQKDLKIFWMDAQGNERIAHDPLREFESSAFTLSGAKDLYFATFDIIIPKNLPDGDYFIEFDKKFCNHTVWDSTISGSKHGNPEYVPLKITVEGLPKKGDIDGDGEIKVADIICLLQYIGDKDKYPLSLAQWEQADCFYEAKAGEKYPSDTYVSKVNAQDLVALLQYALGTVKKLPVYSK